MNIYLKGLRSTAALIRRTSLVATAMWRGQLAAQTNRRAITVIICHKYCYYSLIESMPKWQIIALRRHIHSSRFTFNELTLTHNRRHQLPITTYSDCHQFQIAPLQFTGHFRVRVTGECKLPVKNTHHLSQIIENTNQAAPENCCFHASLFRFKSTIKPNKCAYHNTLSILKIHTEILLVTCQS